MANKKRKKKKYRAESLRYGVYSFILIILAVVSFGTLLITYTISTKQLDKFYKQSVIDTSKNFSSFVDGDFLKELRDVAESEEYQDIRDKAEILEDEEMVQSYLKEKGLWDKYNDTRNMLQTYLSNAENIKYLYIIVVGDKNATRDMYLIDEMSEPLYSLGMWEDREEDLIGADIINKKTVSISHSTWGWLCSGYAKVTDSQDNYVCMVGCDVDMEDIMHSRKKFLLISVSSVIGLLSLALAVTIFVFNRLIAKPIDTLVNEMNKFDPIDKDSYDKAHVIKVNRKVRGEFVKIYLSVQKMQTDIIDHMNNIDKLHSYNVKIERENIIKDRAIQHKDSKIKEISIAATRDALTGVGNKLAYDDKVASLLEMMKNNNFSFAILMIDINNLKQVNDAYGHKAGDEYIKGCCHIVCDTLKHSPVFRIGGDEFVAILSNEDFDSREQRYSELEQRFKWSFENESEKPWRRFSASIGMSVPSENDKSTLEVFNRADEAMYANKTEFKEKHGSYR